MIRSPEWHWDRLMSVARKAYAIFARPLPARENNADWLKASAEMELSCVLYLAG